MSNPKFKPIWDGLLSSSDELGYFEAIELKQQIEQDPWIPEEREQLVNLRSKLRSLMETIHEALDELDPDDDWRDE